jgi:hypothetical protein
MKDLLTEMERDFIIIHLIFSVLCGIVLSIPGIPIGIKLFILVIIYNVMVPLVGILRKYPDWLNIWLFSFILSMLQIWPDWFLSAQLEILVFPEDGLFKIGTVSGYMLFLWAIPFFIILFIGNNINERESLKITYLLVAVLSLMIFGISEMTIWMIGSWYAQNVTMIGHAAIYIFIPEVILGVSTYYIYSQIEEKSHLVKFPAAFIIMLLYLGSAAFFYFLFEKVLFPL